MSECPGPGCTHPSHAAERRAALPAAIAAAALLAGGTGLPSLPSLEDERLAERLEGLVERGFEEDPGRNHARGEGKRSRARLPRGTRPRERSWTIRGGKP